MKKIFLLLLLTGCSKDRVCIDEWYWHCNFGHCEERLKIVCEEERTWF